MRSARAKPTFRPMTEAIPAASSAVPVAERRFTVKIAGSAVDLGATGGTFSTALCSAGTGIFGLYQSFSVSLTGLIPTAKTNAVRKIQGSHACHAGPVAAGAVVGAALTVSFLDSSAGCQKR